jgi:hypothetical protein
MREVIPIGSFASVAASATASIQVPRGPTYGALFIGYTRGGAEATEAQIAADISAVRYRIGGVDILGGLSAAQIQTIYKYKAFTAPSGVLPLWHVDPRQATLAGTYGLTIGTGLETAPFSVEVDLGASASSPALELYALQYPDPDQPRGRMLGAHRRYEKFTDNIAATGTFQLRNWPPPRKGFFLERLFLNGGTITSHKLKLNGREMWNAATKYGTAENCAQWNGFTAQSGWYVIEQCPSREVLDVLNLDVQTLQIEVNATATGALTGIAEYIAVPDNLIQAFLSGLRRR